MQENKKISPYKLSLKDKILETAMNLFAQHGIKAVKMDDIAKALNISKRTLYEIYEDKEVLLFEGVKRYIATHDEDMMRFVSDNHNVMDIIINVYKEKVYEFQHTNPLFYDDIKKYPKVLDYFESCREENHRRLAAFLAKGTKEGYFREDINFDLVVMLFDTISQLVIQQRLYALFSIEHVLNNMMFISLRGICTQKGIDVLDNFMMLQNR